ncbi:MAG: YceI family protein [Bacteroidota bacterium]
MSTKLLLLSILTLLGVSQLAPSWRVADDYAVKFSTTKAEGTFTGLTGTIVFNPADLAAAKFDVSVDAATIQTGNKTKDKHARKSSWFDVENHPRISFVSTVFQQTETGYVVTGELTIKGKTKAVDIPFTFRETASGGLFEGSTKVKREDFGLDGPFLFGGLVGDEVAVALRIPVIV